MIVKSHSTPVYIHKLEALLRRLPPDDHKRTHIKEVLAKRMAGYRGELSIDYPLSFLAEEDYFIFHDIRIFDGTHYFQIDTLILSKWFILVLEVKNIAGKIFFDSHFHQLIRTLDEKEEAFPEPILQVERQCFQFTKWLQLNKFPFIPVEPLVIFTSPRAILRTLPDNQHIFETVILNAKLPAQTETLRKIHQKEMYTSKLIQKLSRRIVKEHCPADVNILQQFTISQKELVKGVFCPACSASLMRRGRGRWICRECSFFSKDAHIESLSDYNLLISQSITNKELRNFLNLSYIHIASKLLISLNLPVTGETRNRSYNLKSMKKKHPPTKRMQNENKIENEL
ncbi:NERD domain-containing protein [Bacillus sp. F19]|nr:NERD domain-containing protein [Bacillus sp. F19]